MNNNKIRKPNIVRGGIAVPLGRNYYYMQGRKHEQGGIDIGKNPRTGLEVEDGEVMHVGNKDIKVFSSLPFLNGKSPAQRVMSGENPNTVFNAQERFKKRNKINDDDTKKKARIGGLYTLSINGKQTLHPFPSTGEVKQSQRQELTGTAIMRAGGRKRKVVGGDVNYVTAPGYRDKRFYITSWEDELKKEQDYINKTKSNPNAPEVVWQRTPKSQEEINYDNSLTNVPQYLRRPFEQRNDVVNNNSVTNPRKSFWSKAKDYLKDNPETISDAIGLVSNLGSSFIGMGLTNRALNRMKYSSEPIPMRAAKLKTRININPQLDRMRESLAAYERNIDENTGSSQVALARKQRARLADVLGRNELYADKENEETELINTDRINQQEVTNKNIESYNTWAAGKAAFENSITEQKANNRIAAINNINAGVQQVVGNIQQRMAEGRTLAALSLGSPNLPAEMFYASGIWNKRMYDAYRRAYPLKRK